MSTFDLMQSQAAQFERDMTKVVTRLEKQVQSIIDKFESIDGSLTVSANNLNNALSVSNELNQALKDSGYYNLAEKALNQNTKLMDVRHTELKKLLGRQRLGQIDTSTFTALNKVSFTGMTDLAEVDFVIRIREAIFNSVNLGLPISVLREEMIKGIGMLKHHANTYIRTAKRQFAQQVEDNAAKLIGFNGKNDIWEYTPEILQRNSHPECVYAVEKQYFTNTEKIEFNSGGGYSHSEPRWNCVHSFVITNITFDEAFGK